MLASQEEIFKASKTTGHATQFCSTAFTADVDINGSSDTATQQHAAMEDKVKDTDFTITASDAKSLDKDDERESEVKEKSRRRTEHKPNRKNSRSDSNITNDPSSDEEKLHNFMLKGVSLGYDHKTVLSALRHVSSETTISGFVEALIRCEEQNNDIDNRYNSCYRREQKTSELSTDGVQAILDGVDIETAYNKDQNGVTDRGIQIAFRALQNFNFSRCIVVFTTWPSFVESKQSQAFIQELVNSNSLISLAEESPEVGTEILKQTLKVKSVIFSRGCSEKSLLHLLKTNRHILPPGRQITIACYHFDFDRFVIEGWNFPLRAKSVDRDLRPIDAGAGDTGKNMFLAAELCPYANKCTYGNKCKYYHPERGTLEQISLTEQLIRKALVEREKLEESFKEKGSLSAIMSERENSFKKAACDRDDRKEEQNIGRFAIEKCSNVNAHLGSLDENSNQNANRLRAKALAKQASLQEETHERYPIKSKQSYRGFPPTCCPQYLLNGKMSTRERKDAKFTNSLLPAPQQAMCMDYQPLSVTLSGSQDGPERFILNESAKAMSPARSYKSEIGEIQACKRADNCKGNYFTWSANGQWPQNISKSVWPMDTETVFYRLPSIHQTSSADTLHSLGKSCDILPIGQRNNRLPMNPNGLYHPSMLGSQDPDSVHSCIYADGINFADASPFNISDGTDGLRLHRGSLGCVAGHSSGLDRACLRHNAKPKRVPFYVDEQIGPHRTIYTMTSDLGSSTFSNSSRSLSLSSSLSSSLNAVGGSFSDLSLRDSKPSFIKPKSDWYLCRDNSDKAPKLSSRSSADLGMIANGNCVKAEVISPVLSPCRGIAENFEHFEHLDVKFNSNGQVKPFAPGFSTVYEHDLGQLRQPGK